MSVDHREPYAETISVSAMTASAETRASVHTTARLMWRSASTRAVTRVPSLEVSIVTEPPTASRRSRMLTRPEPPAVPSIVEAGAVVGDRGHEVAVVIAQGHAYVRRCRVLERVLDRLEAAEVDRELDLRVVSLVRLVPHLDRSRRRGSRRGERRTDAAVS